MQKKLTGKLFRSGGFLMLLVLVSSTIAANELPDFLYSKGGVIYPRTGDSTQTIFHTKPQAMKYLKPGMLIGVLPEDCKSSSHGKMGDIYICNYELYLKPEEKYGKTVYRIIELD